MCRAVAPFYDIAVASGPKLPVQLDLVQKFNGSISGSIKRDAYDWYVVAVLLVSGRFSPPVHRRGVNEFLLSGESDGAHQGYVMALRMWGCTSDALV